MPRRKISYTPVTFKLRLASKIGTYVVLGSESVSYTTLRGLFE